MIISLNPDWRIRSDPLQWIVDQRHVRKPSSPDEYEEWVVWGYFSTLAGAVNGAVGARVRELDMEVPAAALSPILRFLSETRREVDETLKGFTNAKITE